jgi:hypothetical protein
MSLKMAAVCPDARPEIFQPICHRGKHRLQGDLCRSFHEGSLQAVPVLVTLSASHVLQIYLLFIVKVVEAWPPAGPILGADKGRNVPCLHS